jgi:hypothetical protein
MRRTGENPCAGYEQLRAMPQVLRALLTGVTEDEARWKPAPGRWSVLEVLGHLAHVEGRGFRGRVLTMLREENPAIDNYDPEAYAAAGEYDAPSLGAALDEFARERGRSLGVLRSLTRETTSRTGRHSKLGTVTILALLNEWPFHDLCHLRQIAELVRSVKFYPHMGAWQKFYKIQP